MPLWAGTDDPFDVSSFVAYNTDGMSAKLDSSPDDGTDLSGSTLVCLSCHDSGSHAVSAVSGDLSESHPIEMEYNSALVTADGELHDPLAMDGGEIIGGKGTIQKDMLEKDRVTCLSCHEIHANGLHDGLTPATSADGSYSRDLLDAAGDPVVNDNGTPGDDTDDFVEQVVTDVAAGTQFEVEYPHLQNVVGIRWSKVRRGNESDPEDYALVYGALCMTCHKK